MTPRNHLCVFLRVPRIGRVKTRLARDIGAVAAWSFYRDRLARTLGELGGDPRWRLWPAATPERDVVDCRMLRGLTVLGQGGGDLGARMARVVDALPPGPAVIVGVDAPALSARHVAAAFKALGNAEGVFGPAADGGYWLVGVSPRRRVPRIFAGVRWSTRHALADTLASLGGASHVFLETLEDVDDGDSYARWRQWSRQGGDDCTNRYSLAAPMSANRRKTDAAQPRY